MANAETNDYISHLSSQNVLKPVFIAALPRSGTTIILELLSSSNEFCYQTYKDMPFVFTPLLWSKFRKNFEKAQIVNQRLHGDGLKIDLNSPEAFEEMLHMAHRPGDYRHSWLDVKEGPMTGSFDSFFIFHIKKLMYRDGKLRYLSKNNMNICRLHGIDKLFPSAIIVVPFRDPLQHAYSLLKQHQHFLTIHNNSRFSRDYMAGIGHFDFGVNFKPVNFFNWLDGCKYNYCELNFWLEYWLHCYKYLLKFGNRVHFVCYEELIHEPEKSLQNLASITQISQGKLLNQLNKIRRQPVHQVPLDYCQILLTQTRDVYKELCSMSNITQ